MKACKKPTIQSRYKGLLARIVGVHGKERRNEESGSSFASSPLQELHVWCRSSDGSAERPVGWQISALKRAESPPLPIPNGAKIGGRGKQGGVLGSGESSHQTVSNLHADPVDARAQLQHAALSFQA